MLPATVRRSINYYLFSLLTIVLYEIFIFCNASTQTTTINNKIIEHKQTAIMLLDNTAE
jgi:hypothetical protein